MGWTLYQFCTVSTDTILTGFAAESWPGNPGPPLNFVIGARSIIQFGLTDGIQPAQQSLGYAKSYGLVR